MINQANLNENVDTLFRSLENFAQNEGVIGKPVTQGDKTFLPVVSVTVGYGSGDTRMKKEPQGNAASMAAGLNDSGLLGLGAKLCTDAVICIQNQNVTLLPVNANAGSIADKIPQIVSGMSQNKQSSQGSPAQGTG
jgi:uncharacterized spore protein YtfJ